MSSNGKFKPTTIIKDPTNNTTNTIKKRVKK